MNQDDRCGEGFCGVCKKPICFTEKAGLYCELAHEDAAVVCHGHPRQEGKEKCYHPDNPFCHGECAPDTPAPKSGEMEAINEQPLGHTLLYWLQMIKAVKSRESFAIAFPEGMVLSPVAQERELSRQAKELNERWEKKMERVRESMVKMYQETRPFMKDETYCYNAMLAAFDQAAALKNI